jgi:carboxymethylenebutenolidase
MTQSTGHTAHGKAQVARQQTSLVGRVRRHNTNASIINLSLVSCANAGQELIAMCHELTAEPAVFGPGRTTAEGGVVILVGDDGISSRAFLARPEHPTGIGVVVLPDNRGLHPFYERLATRLAEQGHVALALDWYGRTAGTGPRADGFQFIEHLLQVRRDTIDADIATAAECLRREEAASVVYAIGFCFGGRQAFIAAGPRIGLAGAVGFYGAPGVYPNGAPGPTQRATELGAPILAFFGGADEGIPSSDIEAFDAALDEAGVEHKIVTYPGAPHGFFDVHLEEYRDVSADAWRRTLAFLHEPTGVR